MADIFNPYAGTDFGNGGSMAVNLMSGGQPQSSIYNVMQRYGNIGDTATQPPSQLPSGAAPGAMGGNIPMTAMPGMEAAAHVKKPALFGKDGKGWGILGVIGDGLQVAGGGKATFMEMMAKQREQEMEQQIAEQRYQRELADQRARQQVVNLGDGGVGTYSQDGGLDVIREPVPADRTPNAVQVLRAAGIDPTSPEGRDALVRSLSGYQYSQPGIQAIGQAADARAAATAAHRAGPSGGGGRPTAIRVVNGNTYYKINGQWHDSAGGQ